MILLFQVLPRSGASSLGHLEEVQRQLGSVFPGIAFQRGVPGRDRLAELERTGVQLSAALAQRMRERPAQMQGSVREGDLTFDFDLGADSLVGSAMLAVRGAGDPIPRFQALQRATGWRLRHLATEREYGVEEWEAFQVWRRATVRE